MILRHNMAAFWSAVWARNPMVGPKMYKFQLQGDRVAVLNEWAFVSMLLMSCLQLLACVCGKQSPQMLLTKARAQVCLSKIAQKTKPNVTISNPQTQTAIAEADSCLFRTAQVAPART